MVKCTQNITDFFLLNGLLNEKIHTKAQAVATAVVTAASAVAAAAAPPQKKKRKNITN